MHRSEFIKELKAQFPELRHELNQEFGQLHFEVEVLAKYALKAIYSSDFDVLEGCFDLAEKAYMHGDDKLKDAIDVSFVEVLVFDTPSRKYRVAWEMLPPVLQKLYIGFHGELDM